MKRGIPVYINRMIKTAISSSLALGIDLLLLFFFVEFLNIYYILAAAITYAIAAIVNFTICKKWSFKGSKAKGPKEYITFFAFSITYLILMLLSLKLFVETLGTPYLLARIVVSIVLGLVFFILNYVFTFHLGKELPIINHYLHGHK